MHDTHAVASDRAVASDHELMLAQELAAWQTLEALAREQRQAIITRSAPRVDELRGELREKLRLALLAHQQTEQAQPEMPAPSAAPLVREVQEAQVSARDALRFNLELLREVCSYLEMLRSATHPGELSVGYGQDRRPRVVAATSMRRVA